MNPVLHQSFRVSYEYPVIFTRGVFRPGNRSLIDALARAGEARANRAVMFMDAEVVRALPHVVDEARQYLEAHPNQIQLATEPVIVPGGEAIKNDRSHAERMIALLADLRMDRHAFVLATGGGAVLDAVGYAAALVHRGLRLVRLPTTVLAQNDAGVGVKNAINRAGVKNMLGTFAPPFAVLNDLDFLNALPERGWTDGIAEAFKVAIIKDAPFFEALHRDAAALVRRDAAAMERLVIRCAELHLQHIRESGDPFEFGRARPLDFGHWSAHRLEIATEFGLSHGHAVAIGIALDSFYAELKGWLRPPETARICEGLEAAGFHLWHDALERRDSKGQLALLAGLADFQEHLGGELCITMPRGIGHSFEIHEMDHHLIEQAIQRLRARARAVR